MAIARGDKPVVRITPIEAPKPLPVSGAMKGQFAITDAVFEPLPVGALALWNGERA